MLALLAALVGPYFVNWTTYRSDFEREASRVLGREVTVEGEVRARLLPFPSVTFGDVRVAGATPGQPAMTVEEFSMDAELAPFMRGELLIFDMRLVRPRAIFNVAADGSVDWAARPSSRFEPSQVSVESMTVTEGEVTLAHAASGRTHKLTEINADVSADTLAGPWRMDGSLRLDGMLTDVSVATGSVTPEGAMRVRLRADPERYPLEIEADGHARLEDAAALYEGTFRLGARNAAEASAAQTENAAPAAAHYRFSGRFSLDHRRLDLPEFRLETGPRENPYTADGTALFHLGADPRFLVQATGAQVLFESAEGTATDVSGVTFAQRFAALRDALEELPKPTIPGTIDLDLPAIVAGDTTIRDVRLSAEPATDGWRVDTLSATLPGRTTLEASGKLATGEDFGFAGQLLLAVAQPSGFAAWVARDVDDAIRRLPGAGFSADVTLTEARQSFRDVELVLGDTRFEGALDRVARESLRPAMTVKLRGNALDVDGLTAFASLFVSDSGVTHFGGHDIDLDLQAGPVRVAGLAAGAVDAAMRLREDELEVDRLSVTGLAGANISATASLAGIGGAPSGQVDASILAPDLAPLVDVLVQRFPEHALARELAQRFAAFPDMARDAQIDVIASATRKGDGADVAISAQGNTGGNGFTLQARADGYKGDLAEARLEGELSVESPDSAQLLSLYGLPALDLGLTGPGTSSVSIAGVPAAGADLSLAVESSSASVRFDGKLRRSAQTDGAPLAAVGSARLSAGDLEPWLMTTGMVLPGMGIGLPVELSAEATLSADRLNLAGLKGSVAGTAVSGDLGATWQDGVPHLEGALDLAGLDLVNAAGLVLGEEALEAEGEGWPSVPFAGTPRLPFTAQLDLAVKALDAGFQPLADDVTLSARLDGDGLRISDFSGRMFGGTVKGLVELANGDGTGLLSAQFALADADAADVLGAAAIEGQASIGATVTASGKSVEGLVASLAGSGTAQFRNLVIPGVDPDALDPILAAADEMGRDIDAGRVAAVATGGLGGGRFAARDLDVPFTIAGGTVRTAPFFLEADGATIPVELQAHLTSGEIEGTGSIEFDAGSEALVGSQPSVRLALGGSFGETAVNIDAAPLTQFLTQRALEREQARVEAMQAGLLEKQRLRREVRYYAALEDQAARLRQQETKARATREAAAAADSRSPGPLDPPVPSRPSRPAASGVEFNPDAIDRILKELPDRP